MFVCAYVHSCPHRHLRKNGDLTVPVSLCQTANPWKNQQENSFAEMSLTSEHESFDLKKKKKSGASTSYSGYFDKFRYFLNFSDTTY